MDAGSGDADCGSTLARGAKKLKLVFQESGDDLATHPAVLFRFEFIQILSNVNFGGMELSIRTARPLRLSRARKFSAYGSAFEIMSAA